MRQKAPVTYQTVQGGRRLVASGYVLDRPGEVAFRLGAYDPDRLLVIDPVLSDATFRGGSGAAAGQDVAVAPDGSLWVLGTTFSSDLPGAGNSWSGDEDAFVSHSRRTGRRSWAPRTSVAPTPTSRTA